VKNMRDKLFSHIQHLPFSWHMKNQTGDIIQRCTSDVETIKNFVAEQLTSVVKIVILIAFSLVCMFSMNTKLTLVASFSVPIVVIYSVFFHNKFSTIFRECDENEGVLSTIAQENLTGMRVVSAFGRQRYERDKFEKQNNIYTMTWVRLCNFLSMFWATGDMISGLQVMLVIVLGSVFCVRGEMTAGELIAFISYNTMIIWPVRGLGRVISEMSKAKVSLNRIRYIMSAEVEKDKDNAITPDLNGDIVFENVSFAYDDGVKILDNINLTIPQGSVLGILGGTGCGKSTLMHLLNRLYDLPEENGTITIGGTDIADMKGQWVRENVGMVLQEPFLFSRTIGENIGIAVDKVTLSQIRNAANIACLDENVQGFSKGYDTVVGERGVTLSGGQKQRATIARMLVKKTPIMVFDDSFSSIDAETDAKIRKVLKDSFGSSTVILISHRIATLMQADKIAVMDHGRIVETGNHEQLMDLGGIYKKIHDLQMNMEGA